MYRLGQVASAIGVEKQAVRNWLHYEKNKSRIMMSERPAGTWRAFELRHAYLLGLVSRLVRFGVKVNDAFDAADGFMFDAFYHPSLGKSWGEIYASVDWSDVARTFPQYMYASYFAPGESLSAADSESAFVDNVNPQDTLLRVDVHRCFEGIARRLKSGEPADAERKRIVNEELGARPAGLRLTSERLAKR